MGFRFSDESSTAPECLRRKRIRRIRAFAIRMFLRAESPRFFGASRRLRAIQTSRGPANAITVRGGESGREVRTPKRGRATQDPWPMKCPTVTSRARPGVRVPWNSAPRDRQRIQRITATSPPCRSIRRDRQGRGAHTNRDSNIVYSARVVHICAPGRFLHYPTELIHHWYECHDAQIALLYGLCA